MSDNFHPEEYVKHLKTCKECRDRLHKHIGLFTDTQIQKIEKEFLGEK